MIWGMAGGRPHGTGSVLGEILVESGMNATQLSARSGVHPRTLTEYLSGRRRPLPHHLASLADALDVDPQELLDD